MKLRTLPIFILFLWGSMFARAFTNSTFTTSPHDSLVVIVPTVFTPNNDGINDTWSIIVHDYGVILFDLQTTVYDRWGTLVFQSTDLREVWLGYTPTGRVCHAGSYFYVISYTNSLTNQPEKLKGFVELIR
ncbi:MAG TPA: gliding motility-associated C-terminal domain-containing protein [Bacteroidia bacterium]